MVNLTGPMRKLVVGNPMFFFPKILKFKITYSRRLCSEAPFIFYLFFWVYSKVRNKFLKKAQKNIRKYPSAI